MWDYLTIYILIRERSSTQRDENIFFKMMELNLIAPGVASHISIGFLERDHAYLRQIFLKVHGQHRNFWIENVLILSVKDMNQKAGINGLPSVLLVFSVHPIHAIPILDLPGKRNRISYMETAREEIIKVMAEKIFRTSFTNNTSSSENNLKEPVSAVLIYWEGTKEWNGPFQVVTLNKNQFMLN